MTVPQEIKDLKPKGFGPVEIRFIGGYYYVYQVTSHWVPEKKKAKKKTGLCIGKITPEKGFVPNANGAAIMQSAEDTSKPLM